MALMSFKLKQELNIFKKGKLSKFIYIIIVLLLLQNSFQNDNEPNITIRKISKVNLLLPICPKANCNEVYAKLIAYNGCYE